RNILQLRPNIAAHQLSHRSKRHACSSQQKILANKSKRQSIRSRLQRCSRNLLQLRPNIAPHQPSHRSKRHACTNQQKISANKSKRQSIWSRLQRCSRSGVEEARVQQPAEELSKQEQEAVHTESVAEVQQESPAASPQHSTTPTITQVEEARVQ
ncbi:unnamed protein product, partial [Durusdinium trenchii]